LPNNGVNGELDAGPPLAAPLFAAPRFWLESTESRMEPPNRSVRVYLCLFLHILDLSPCKPPSFVVEYCFHPQASCTGNLEIILRCPLYSFLRADLFASPATLLFSFPSGYQPIAYIYHPSSQLLSCAIKYLTPSIMIVFYLHS